MTDERDDDHDYGLTRGEQKICILVAIRDYLRDRRDDPDTPAAAASVLSVEVLRLNEAIAKAEAEVEA